MKNTQIILAGMMVIALLCSVGTVAALDDNATGAPGADDVSDAIAPYNGPIGADSPLYGLKLAMEDLDETFTFNDTQRMEKRLDHGRIRIAEVRRELQRNRTDTAERALELYRQKLNLTEGSLTPFASNANGLLHAQEMITRHQEVLASLVFLYPNNTGLARAYNNSQLLELKFEDKTEMRFTRFMEKNNKTVLKVVRLEIRKQDHGNDDNATAVETMEQDRNQDRERIKDQKDVITVNTTISTQPGHRDDTPSGTTSPQDNRGSRGITGKKEVTKEVTRLLSGESIPINTTGIPIPDNDSG
jgi:hypothetical protein